MVTVRSLRQDLQTQIYFTGRKNYHRDCAVCRPLARRASQWPTDKRLFRKAFDEIFGDSGGRKSAIMHQILHRYHARMI